MNESKLNYHPAVNFYQRLKFPGMYEKLGQLSPTFMTLLELVIKNKANGLITALVYSLTEWLLSHLHGKGMVYAMDFEGVVAPILKDHSSDSAFTSRVFTQRFRAEAQKALDERFNRAPRRATRPTTATSADSQTVQDKPGGHLDYSPITDKVAKIPIERICDLAKTSQVATERKFITAFCRSILSEVGVTDEMLKQTYIYATRRGDPYRLRKQVVKAVMIQLRLRICAEASKLSLIKVGENLPFSRTPRPLLRVGNTGMLIIPQGENGKGTTHVNPIFFPLLVAIEKAIPTT